MSRLADAGVAAPVVVGGIIPPDDEARLTAAGVAAVYTPKDFELGRIMASWRPGPASAKAGGGGMI